MRDEDLYDRSEIANSKRFGQGSIVFAKGRRTRADGSRPMDTASVGINCFTSNQCTRRRRNHHNAWRPAHQLYLVAAQAVDERPDGAWHSEWPAVGRLLEAGITDHFPGCRIDGRLDIDTNRMKDRVAAAADDLLSERGSGGKPADYLGSTDAFIDAVFARVPEERAAHS